MLPLVAIWLYEICNVLVLSVQGDTVSLTMNGWIPLGVAGVSTGVLSPLTKFAQVALATGTMIPLVACLTRARLAVSRALSISLIGVFVASTYWEFLSQLKSVPMSLHIGIFLGVTASISFGLLRGLSGAWHLRARFPILQR
jgi:hypothetical protein